MSTEQSRTAEAKEQAEIRRQADYLEVQARRLSRSTNRTEQAGSNRSTEQSTMLLSKEHTGRTKSSSEQSVSKQLLSQLKHLKLSDFVDVQHLMNIGYRNPELLPLIKRISVVGEIMGNFDTQVQSELVAMIKIVEKTVKEFVYMKSTAYNSDAIEETIYRLLPQLSKSFSNVVLKQGRFILDPSLRNLVEWKKISEKLSKKKIPKIPSMNLFDLSMRFQMKDLIKIGYDHPEFRTHIKTVFGVNAAMKHLKHEGQVEIYKILRRIEKIIKELVQEKTKPDGCHDIFLTPETLSSSLDYCIEKILKYLKSLPEIQMECLQCEMDRSYVRNVHIKPVLGTLKRPRVTEPKDPQPKQQTIFECANWGVSHDSIKNLESLIHHLAAKEGAFVHTWLFENCVDWFQIASMFADYRLTTRQDMAGMQTLRLQILMKLDQMEKVMTSANGFCYRMKNVPFTENETLSDAIALSGEIEMLATEVENYFKMFELLIKELFSYKKEYTTLSTTIRANRLLFLTKTQWKAFDFPFY